MDNKLWIERADKVFVPTYSRQPAVMVEGDGCLLKDASGKEYLDFVSGIAVCSLGHCHPEVTRAVQEQAARLVHVSNLYYSIPQIELAELLVQHSFGERVFFANSGAEANEAAIKLARKFSRPGCYEIITLEGSFHGRTLATVAATGQKKFGEGFEPLPAGFIHVPFGNIDALADAVTERTCAILCEPLQGEGGVRPLPLKYLQKMQQLCVDKDLLLIFDEVQVGMGRTGTFFAYEQFGIIPDIMTIAKALGNGMPIGAMVTTQRIAEAFSPGSHASTFGGNPVACAAATVCVKIIAAAGFLATVRERGKYLVAKLWDIARKYPDAVQEVRGMGLIQGLLLKESFIDCGPVIVERMFQKSVLINFAGGKALRFVPPLIVTENEIDRLSISLDEVFNELGLHETWKKSEEGRCGAK